MKKNTFIKRLLKNLAIAAVWLLVWQAVSFIIGKELLLPSPLTVAKRLASLLAALDFYKAAALSLCRIAIGLICGMLLGAVGGIFSAFVPVLKSFFAPVLALIKATPVVSFIILLVLWISRDATPAIVAGMMTLPIIWEGVESGILNTDKSLIEMANAYNMTKAQKIKHIYLSSTAPYFFTSLRSSMGISWKAGIAAEVILLPLISIGKQISDANYTLETADLFAWTAVVVIISVIIEKTALALFSLSKRKAREGKK